MKSKIYIWIAMIVVIAGLLTPLLRDVITSPPEKGSNATASSGQPAPMTTWEQVKSRLAKCEIERITIVGTPSLGIAEMKSGAHQSISNPPPAHEANELTTKTLGQCGKIEFRHIPFLEI